MIIKFDMWLYRMQARQILYSQHYPKLSALPKPLVETSSDKNWAAYSECGMLLADGKISLQHHQKVFAQQIDERFNKIIQQLTAPTAKMFQQSCQLMQEEFHAYRYAATHMNACKEELAKALHIQFQLQATKQSLTLPFLPAQEVWGEILQSFPTEYQHSLDLYNNELKFNPQRFQAEAGKKYLLQRLKKAIAKSPHAS